MGSGSVEFGTEDTFRSKQDTFGIRWESPVGVLSPGSLLPDFQAGSLDYYGDDHASHNPCWLPVFWGVRSSTTQPLDPS